MAIDYQFKNIWDVLINYIGNPYGAAGLMGNLFAESSLDPACVTGSDLKTKEAKDTYVKNVKNEAISEYSFARDGVAFGLAQWRYWSRKEALMTYSKVHGKAIDDLQMQLDFLCQEIATYKTVFETLKTARSIKEASGIVMDRYEKPGNISEKAKEKRAAFGQECYDLFANGSLPEDCYRYVMTKVDKVNLRCGNGKEYGAVLQAKNRGQKYKWVATADNGWFAVVVQNRVLWISPEFSTLMSG